MRRLLGLLLAVCPAAPLAEPLWLAGQGTEPPFTEPTPFAQALKTGPAGRAVILTAEATWVAGPNTTLTPGTPMVLSEGALAIYGEASLVVAGTGPITVTGATLLTVGRPPCALDEVSSPTCSAEDLATAPRLTAADLPTVELGADAPPVAALMELKLTEEIGDTAETAPQAGCVDGSAGGEAVGPGETELPDTELEPGQSRVKVMVRFLP